MKSIISVIALLFGALLFAQAQDRTVKFTRMFDYQVNEPLEQNAKDGFNQLFSQGVQYYYSTDTKDGLLVIPINTESESYLDFMDFTSYYLITKNRALSARIQPLTRKVKTRGEYSLLSSSFLSKKLTIKSGVAPKKIKINGTECTQYTLENNKEKATVCIDEKSPYDNVSWMIEGAKGLLVSMEMADAQGSIRVELKDNKVADLSLVLNDDDIHKSIDESNLRAVQKEIDTYVNENKPSMVEGIYDDYSDNYDILYDYYSSDAYEKHDINKSYHLFPIISSVLNSFDYDSENNTSQRAAKIAYIKKQYPFTLKNQYKNNFILKEEREKLERFFKDFIQEVEQWKPKEKKENKADEEAEYAIASIPQPVEEYNDDSYVFPYESFKNYDISEEPSLALTEVAGNEKIMKAVPDFCKDLKNKIPTFENKELRKYVHNYLGQVCDMYLYQNGGSVDYYGTLGSMRKSFYEIEKLRPSLSKKDAQMLQDLLLSLD